MKFKKIILNGFWILVLLFAFGGTPAFSNDCDAEIAKVNKEITTTNPLPMETLLEAQALRDQADALCKAGKVAEGMALLDQAKALLGIQ